MYVTLKCIGGSTGISSMAMKQRHSKQVEDMLKVESTVW